MAIDDKHFETIVRQMLRKVTVIDPGQTTLLEDEQIDKTEFAAVNEKAIAEGANRPRPSLSCLVSRRPP